MEQDDRWFTVGGYNRLYKSAPVEWHDFIRDIQLIQMLVNCMTENSQQDINSKIYDIVINQVDNYSKSIGIDFETPKAEKYEDVYAVTNLIHGLTKLESIAKWQWRKGGYNFGKLIEGYDIDRYKELMLIGINICIVSMIAAIRNHKKKINEQAT